MSAQVKEKQISERPILFSGSMVNAILEGRKTQTRRVVKGEPVDMVRFIGRDNEPTGEFGWCPHERVITKHVRCPYGWIGDRLWVRETFAPHDDAALSNQEREFIYYRADDETKYDTDGTWKPSIFMPRWASRITLEITNVRVERLQEISCVDVLAEGSPVPLREHSNPELGLQCVSAKEWFSHGWDSINGKRKGRTWADNPFVWVIEFKKL